MSDECSIRSPNVVIATDMIGERVLDSLANRLKHV